MKSLVLLLALGQFIGPNGGTDSSPFAAPLDFIFTAPAAGAFSSLIAGTGQTITCTRASSSGYVTAATYTAATQPSTNVFTRSADLHHADWNNVGNTVANVGTAPDGTNSLTQINASCSFQNNGVQSLFTTAGPFTVSGYFQQADASNTTAGLYGYCGPVAVTSCTCLRDDASPCTTSSAGLAGTICTATSTVGATTARLSLTWSCASAPSGGGAALCAGSYPGAGNIKAWGGQAEALGVETNYIPTVASAVSRGLVQTATTNQCAVDFRGLQVEGGGTNVALRSEAFDNATWQLFGSGAAAPTKAGTNAIVAPDGHLTAEEVDFPAIGAAQTSELFQTLTTIPATAYTISIWLKGKTTSGSVYLFWAAGAVGSNPATCAFNNSTWTRCVSPNFTVAGTSNSVALGAIQGSNGMGTLPAQNLYVWGAQVEASPFATSYIATAGTSVARAGDANSLPKPSNVQMAGAGAQYSFSLTAQAEGLFAATAQEGVGSNASFVPLFQVQDNTANHVSAYSDTVPTAAAYSVAGLDALKTSQAVRYAMNVTAGKVQACANGTCGAAVSVGAQPSEPTTLFLGSFNAGAAPLFGWISAACLSRTSTGCAP